MMSSFVRAPGRSCLLANINNEAPANFYEYVLVYVYELVSSVLLLLVVIVVAQFYNLLIYVDLRCPPPKRDLLLTMMSHALY
jgi:hypothetical protein